MKLYIIRHGQTDWNAKGMIQGRQNVPLNQEGRHQAECLARGMSSRPVTVIFSSPQQRALDTARAIAKERNTEIQVLPQLEEIYYGDWEGKTASQIPESERELFEAWWRHPVTVAPPHGETLAQVDERCRQAWESIKAHMNGDGAVVAHGGTLAHLIMLLLKGQEDAREIVVDNASITTLEYDPQTGRCHLLDLNDVSHLK